jgi:hypothetical protein
VVTTATAAPAKTAARADDGPGHSCKNGGNSTGNAVTPDLQSDCRTAGCTSAERPGGDTALAVEETAASGRCRHYQPEDEMSAGEVRREVTCGVPQGSVFESNL